MQEPLDSDNVVHDSSWSQRNALWIGLVCTGLLFIGYAIFTANMNSVFKSMSSSIHKDGTVLISDGLWLKIWSWSALVPIIVPTFVTLFLYRYKSQQAPYLQLVKRSWIVSFVGMLLISAVAMFLFKVGSFIPVESKGLEMMIVFFATAIIAFVLSLVLSVFFIKAKR